MTGPASLFDNLEAKRLPWTQRTCAIGGQDNGVAGPQQPGDSFHFGHREQWAVPTKHQAQSSLQAEVELHSVSHMDAVTLPADPSPSTGYECDRPSVRPDIPASARRLTPS
jgi:hypothetical protein